VALALSGLLFFLYPAVRPWHDESTVAGAVASMSSDAWVAAHLFAMLALILMPLGMLAVCVLAAGRRGAGLTRHSDHLGRGRSDAAVLRR